MEKVTVLGSYILEGYTLVKVKPSGFIDYGANKDMFCFDYNSLAEQWGISLDVLDKVASYDISFKYSMFVSITETEEGRVKTHLIDANAVPNLLRKLKDSTYRPNTDINREYAVIATLIDNARRYKNDKSKSITR